MGIISTAILLGFGNAPAWAQETARHPVIGDIPARDLLNADLLALPDRERQAWVHGASAQMVQVVAAYDPETARCVSDFFVSFGDGQEQFEEVALSYPEKRATVTMMAVSATACEIIREPD